MLPRPLRLGLAALVLPTIIAGQGQARRAPALGYRGFSAGMPYREFAALAQSLARRDTLRCQTMRRTAQVMDCGVSIRDPADSARFYLSANVIEGRVSIVSFKDSGGTAVVERAQRDLTRRFGPAHRRERSMWEWTSGRRFVRLNWRGRGAWRVVFITLNDRDVMDRISRYRPASPPSAPPARRAP